MTIPPIVAMGPSGLRKPRAVSVPPPNSDAAATVAQGVPGFRPSDSSQPAVPFSPGPLNQPKSFCDPWPANNPPIVSRKISSPISFIVLDSLRPLNRTDFLRVAGIICFSITARFIVGSPSITKAYFCHCRGNILVQAGRLRRPHVVIHVFVYFAFADAHPQY